MRVILLATFLINFLPYTTHAADVGGIINSDITWTLANSPYIVAENVLVSEGVTLTIEPGVEIKFESKKVLQVEGALIARGTSDNVITFTSNQPSPAPGDWGYIYFTDTSSSATFDVDGNYTGGSILEYCIVEYAGGLDLDNNGAVRTVAALPFINYCTIQDNTASGINCDGRYTEISGELKITNNTIKDNTALTGVHIDLRKAIITISSNTIVNNIGGMGGIYITRARNADAITTITDNIVSNNSGNLRIDCGSNVTIKNNTISYSSAWGLLSLNSNSVTIDSNIIKNNKLEGLGVSSKSTTVTNNTVNGNFGRGVSIGGLTTTLNSNIILRGNIIKNNSGGVVCGYGEVTIINNIIHNNYTEGSGGGIIVNSGLKKTITKNIISNNVASVYGGGISTHPTYGSCPFSISKNTIVNNRSQNASAVYYLPWDTGDDRNFSQNTITGNISTCNEPTYAVNINLHTLFNYNNIFDNVATYELYNADQCRLRRCECRE